MYRIIPLLAFFCAMPSFAQDASNRDAKNFDIPRTSSPPRLDGFLDDEAWQTAEVRTDLLQRRPLEYAASSERTEVYFTFDEDALYVAVYAHDSRPQDITAFTLEQGGNMFNDDTFSLMLDPFNSERGGYQFSINPNGVRSESIYTSPTRSSDDWDGIWASAARIVEDGWIAEMKIPFKSISFDPQNSTWGVNFWRNLQRNQETMAWYSFNGSSNPTSAGKMRGITDVTQGVGLDVIPALGATYYEDHIGGISESNVQPSVDLFYKITPQISLAVTLNTDFSAVEADSNSLNLSRFRQFFQEKRSFFLNDFDVFNFGLDSGSRMNGVNSGNNSIAFYSRSIGLSDNGQPVDIDGGLKLSGRIGDTEFGTLVTQQQEHELVSRTGAITPIDADTAIVARVTHPVFSESKIGVIMTDGSPTYVGDNSLMGVDFQYRDTSFIPGKSIDAIAMYQQTDSDNRVLGGESTYTLAVSLGGNTGWSGGAQYFAVEPGYNPGLGFSQRTDAELVSGAVQYEWLFEDNRYIREIRSGLSGSRWNILETGELDSQSLRLNIAQISFTAGGRLNFGADKGKEEVRGGQRTTGDLNFNIPAGLYTETNYSANYSTPSHWDWGARVNLSYGDYFTGTRSRYGYSMSWQPNTHLSLDAGFDLTQYDLPEGTTYVRQLDFDVEIAFNSSVALSTQLEFDNVRREITFNNRLRWNIQPGQDLYLVYNESYLDQTGDSDFTTSETNAAFKFRYTYRF